MECKYGEELLVPYLLGAIDDRERRLMDSHLDSCTPCSLALQGDGEAVARLASALPQLEVPPRIKERLLDRIDRERRKPLAASRWLAIAKGLAISLRGAFAPHMGKALASTLIVGVVFSIVWFNGRIESITQENVELTGQLDAAAQREAEVMQAVEELTGRPDAVAQREAQATQAVMTQRDVTYEALRMSFSSDTSVNLLEGTGPWTSARGMIIVSQAGTRALLLVVDLPPLPSDRVYQVWLIKHGRRYSAGWFTVDSTGYGQTVIIPVAPLGEFEAAGITIEPAGGSNDPTGASVLKGDL